MSKQYPGGIVSKTPVTPTSLSAPGIWTMNQQAAAQATNTWPFPRDPQFNYVTMLLHGDGSAGVPSTGSGAGASSTVTNFNADASTNNFNVTINGDTKSNNFTPYQADGYWSVGFTGAQTSPSLTYPSISAYDLGATSQFTYECWVYFASVSGEQSIFERFTGTSGPGWLLTKLSTNVYRAHFGSGVYIDTGAIAVAGQWIHLAVSRDGSTGSLFVDGIRQATTSSVVNFSDGTDPLVFGERNSSGQTFPFNGYISNARIVKGTYVYNPSSTSITVPTSPLTAITNTVFLGLQSNRYIDNSSNNATATASSASSVQGFSPFTQSAASLNAVATYGSGYFDGNGDTLSLASQAALNFSTGDFTLEAWVYATTTLGDATCILTAVTNGGMMFGTNGVAGSGVWAIGRKNTAWDYSSSTVPAVNQWQHVAVCRSGTSVRIFINGVQSGTTGTNSTAYDLGLGGTVIGYQVSYMNGYFSSIRATNTALYTTTFTPPTTLLTAVSGTALLTTQYNGGGNNSGFKDSSQFNFPITRNGNTTQGTFTPYGSNWSTYTNATSTYFTSGTSAVFGFGTGDWTFEFFINSLSFTDNQFIVDFRPSGSAGSTYPWIYLTTTGVLNYGTAGAVKINSSAGAVTGNTWTHVAVSKASGSTRMFVNGVQVGSTYTDSNDYGSSARFVSGTFGDAPGGGSGTGFVQGYLSNLRILKGTGLYTGSYTVPTSPLTAITNTSCLTFQSNRFIDNSGNSIAITPSGSPSVQRFSPFAPLTVYNPTTYGGSGYFDGSGDYLTATQNAAFNLGTGAFTVEAWVYITASNGTNQRVIGLGDGAIGGGPYTGWTFNINNALTTINWYRYDGTETNLSASYTFNTNTWYHIVAVRNGSSNLSMYVNGTRVYNNTSATLTYNNVNSNPLYLGAITDGAGGGGVKYFNGYMSSVRVVAGTAVYDPTVTTLTVPTAPLTAITNTSLLVSTTNPAILDNSMLNNLETVGNAAVSTSVKKYGAASMYFDGTDDRLNMPSSPNLAFGTGDFTLEMWAYFTSVASFPTLTDSRSSTGSTAGFNLGLSTAKVQLYTTSQLLIGSSTLSTNTWYHIAVTRASGTLKIWLNGVQDATVSNSTNWSDQTFVVGATPTPNNYMTGYIDDLRITKGVARYTATFTVPDQAFPNG
jgi:hypothetical protein